MTYNQNKKIVNIYKPRNKKINGMIKQKNLKWLL